MQVEHNGVMLNVTGPFTVCDIAIQVGLRLQVLFVFNVGTQSHVCFLRLPFKFAVSVFASVQPARQVCFQVLPGVPRGTWPRTQVISTCMSLNPLQG